MIRTGCQGGIFARAFARDSRGASLVEYLLGVGCVGLVALFGFRFFGASLMRVSEREASCVATLAGDCAGGAVAPGASDAGGAAAPSRADAIASAAAPAAQPSTAQATPPSDPLQFVDDIRSLAIPWVVVASVAATGRVGEMSVSFAELFVRPPATAMLLAPWIEGALVGGAFAAKAAAITSREVDKAKPGIKNVLCNGQFAAAPECRATQ